MASTITQTDCLVETVRIQKALEAQKAFFEQGKTKKYSFRVEMLNKLRDSIIRNETVIYEALRKDLGKSPFESYASEIGFCLEEIKHTLAHLKSWMKPKFVTTPLTQFLSWGHVYSEPYGNTLIISPWNYPFQLAIAPLIGSISAGNCAIIKPSELSPNTSAVLEKLIQEAFDPAFVQVITGGIETNQALLEQKFGYIFFTGSTQVGKIVMQAAAKHLTPVTLELGGKSPCIIDKDYASCTAKRIVWGKFFNVGQTCVAPDYLLVHSSVKEKLLQEIVVEIKNLYGENPALSEDYGRIINEKHFYRLIGYLNDGVIYFGGKHDLNQRYISPTILVNVKPNSSVMEDEIFGPILPIFTFKHLQEVFFFLKAKPKHLEFFFFLFYC
ncbi:MAG: aldehyde dehydrogenase family protein [Bacteroidia bacterium]|nr:aldehyde dehydrogenase family protein [Bacteroidia bacterium]